MGKKTTVNLSPITFGIIFCLVFCGAGIFTIVSYFKTAKDIERKNRVCTEETTAVVLSVRTETRLETVRETRHGKTTKHTRQYEVYIPTIRYTASGTDIITEYKASRDSGAYRVQQSFSIMYDPENPDEYYIKGIDEENSVVAPIVGGIFFIIGLIIFIVMIKINKKQKSSNKNNVSDIPEWMN